MNILTEAVRSVKQVQYQAQYSKCITVLYLQCDLDSPRRYYYPLWTVFFIQSILLVDLFSELLFVFYLSKLWLDSAQELRCMACRSYAQMANRNLKPWILKTVSGHFSTSIPQTSGQNWPGVCVPWFVWHVGRLAQAAHNTAANPSVWPFFETGCNLKRERLSVWLKLGPLVGPCVLMI